MKKFIAIPILMLCLFLVACNGDELETLPSADMGYGTHPYIDPLATVSPEDESLPSLSEMSPESTDITLPQEITIKVSEIDFDSFEEIDPEDSVLPDAGHDKVLDSGSVQYFFVEDDIKIHALFFEASEDGKKTITGSASYNSETGYIEFYGNSDKTWYYNEEGVLRCIVYTFSFGAGTPSIYTFYSPEGQKEVTRTIDGWYTPDYDLLTNEEILDYLEKYEGTIEATAAYRSSDITGLS